MDATHLLPVAVGLGLTATLLVLAWIDCRRLILPDVITLPLLAAGLLLVHALAPDRLIHHAIGAALGYGAMAVLAAGYRGLRARDGLGGGDVKLMAAAGAWVSWEGLASVLLLAAASGLGWVAASSVLGRASARDRAIPFGPHLCLGLWLVWVHGPVGAA